MAKEFMLPELGENIQSADVLNVLVAKGDIVTVDQPVLEIETDKATIEVPSSISGKIREIFVKPGEKLKVGQVVFVLEPESGASVIAVPADLPEEKTPVKEERQPVTTVPVNIVKTAPAEMLLPGLGENITSADVLKVLVKPGDKITLDDPVLEIETDKATIEVPSTVSGIISEVFIKEGEKASVGQVVLKVTASDSLSNVQAEAAVTQVSVQPEKAGAIPKPQPKAALIDAALSVSSVEPFAPIETQPGILENPAPAAPSVRRLARELGVNINNVPGSGPSGRITLDDVKAYVKSLNPEQKAVQPAPVNPLNAGYIEPLPDFTNFGQIEKSAMSNIRAKTAEHLSYAWATIPHVTQFDKADITELENLRKHFASKVEAKGGKLTVTAILIKVVASALKAFPQFNSSVDMANKEIIYKKYFNIGVAVDTDRGLIVPVIKNVDKLNAAEISAELNRLSEKARQRKISPEDLQGGCFTISNLGGIGGTSFTPVVNSPEVAILGVSRGAFEPVYRNGSFVPRLMLPLSLSYDHRVIDGADGIRFLRWIIEALEQPMKILIEG